MSKKIIFKKYFITTTKNNEGVEIITDNNFELTKNDLFINPITNILLIVSIFKNSFNYSKTLIDLDFEKIKIEELK